MKKSEGLKYFNKVWDQMNLHLKNYLETGDQEELHGFRVQIKKLKAFIIMLEKAETGPQLTKLFKPVIKVFKSAGHLREAYINLKLTERYKIKNETFENGQNQIITEGLESFRSQSDKILKNIKEVYKVLIKNLPKVKNSIVIEFYNSQLNELDLQLQSLNFTEDMHQNRKLIKLLVYNYKLAEPVLNQQMMLNAEYLEKLQAAIGDWHDNLVAAQLFSSESVNDPHIVKVINRKNSTVKKNIRNLASEFIKKATLAGDKLNEKPLA